MPPKECRLLFLLISLTTLEIIEGVSNELVFAKFKKMKQCTSHKKLVGHEIETFGVRSENKCVSKCRQNENCKSVNVINLDGKFICELNSCCGFDCGYLQSSSIPAVHIRRELAQSDCEACMCGDSCSLDAVCISTEGTFSCQCKPGYSGNGTSCSDVNECSNGDHTCDTNADCSNTERKCRKYCKFNLYQAYEQGQMLQCESVTRDEPWGLVYITQGVSTVETCIAKACVCEGCPDGETYGNAINWIPGHCRIYRCKDPNNLRLNGVTGANIYIREGFLP